MGAEMEKIKGKKYIIMYSDRHGNYGLFKDLNNRENVQLVEITTKHINNNILKAIRRIHLSKAIASKIHLPLKYIWYVSPQIKIEKDCEYYLLIVDIVLFSVSVSYIKTITKKHNVKSILLMLNSVSTGAIKQITKELNSIKWNSVYTFDDKDAERYGFNKIGYCYYSMHNKNKLEKNFSKDSSDAYFIGTIKATRKNEILSMYNVLKSNGLKTEFHLLKTVKEHMKELPYKGEIDYFTSKKGLIPYEEILASVIKTKVIIEIVQEGQTGPTLRYYEAVCYNKKLLTNNPYITSFPLYNERYMRVYEKPEDVDIEWLREEIEVNYHYNNEFSPVHLLDKIRI